MESLKTFAMAVFKIGAGIALSTLLVVLAIWGWYAYRTATERRANAPLAEKHEWPTITADALGGAKFNLATVWRDGRIFYRLSVEGYPPLIAAARDAGSGASFTFVFYDADGFKVFQKSIQLSSMSAVIDPNGERSGLQWTEDEFSAAESYRRAAT